MIHGLDAHLCSGVGYGGGVGGCDWQATTIAADAIETSATYHHQPNAPEHKNHKMEELILKV